MKPDDVKIVRFFCFYLSFSHSNNRFASSNLNNCVPSFIVAAEPQATPQRITSFRLLFFESAQTIPPTILSPAPTVLFLATLGAGTNSKLSLVTKTAPCGPRETTTISAPPLAMICLRLFYFFHFKTFHTYEFCQLTNIGFYHIYTRFQYLF